MKQTDFAVFLTEFLKIYLPGHRRLSNNTVSSYRDTFRFMLMYAEEKHEISAERLRLENITADFVFGYLNWLEDERHNSAMTRRQRLAAIHVFVHFLKLRKPEYLLEFQKILDIKIKKKEVHAIGYLSPEEVGELLSNPDLTEKLGRRDMVLLSLLYDSGARVQEICDLRVSDLRLNKPSTVLLTGKGDKSRIVPLMSETADILRKYIAENGFSAPEKQSRPLFTNRLDSKLTRAGIAYILKKHCDAIRKNNSSFPKIVSPHQLRHSKAMHMLKAGTDLIYIRDFLGHSQIATTEIYAKADTDMKRRAIENASPRLTPDLPDWTKDGSLMEMLTDLCK
jgi:site-specific recombinase XerD